MDIEAHSACLRALSIVARSCRLCAGDSTTAGDPDYRSFVESAERAIYRAEQHYATMRAGHAQHERAVRLVETAVVEARLAVRVLQEGLAEPETIDRIAAKIERAVARAGLSQERIYSGSPPSEPDP